jgi:hypothetical protein
MWDYLVVLIVLSPVEVPVNPDAPPEAWQALKTISLELEVVGPHERWVPDFRSEVRYVRAHVRALQDAPSLNDCEWLPSAETVADGCRFSEQYQMHLQTQMNQMPHREQEIGQALEESRRLYRVWDTVRRAALPQESWVSRRRALGQLRDALGDEAYYSGQLPPCVPVWRFREID